jgi:hypothetical protein
MLRRCLKLAGIVALIAYPILFLIWRPSGFPIDIDACQHYTAGGECAYSVREHIYLFLLRKFGDLLRDSAFVTALATIAIAGFTLTLKRSTDKLFVATSESVDVAKRALTDLERPYVFFHGIDCNMNFYLSPNTGWNQERHSPEFFPTLINYGRTPANLVFGAVFFEVGRFIPPEFEPPSDSDPVDDPSAEWVEIVIGPNSDYKFSSQRLRHIFPHAYAIGIRDGAMNLYCHGFVTYRDIFKNVHWTKWCRRYLPRRGEWQPDGGLERNGSN